MDLGETELGSLDSTGAFDHKELSTSGDKGVGGVLEFPGDIGHAEASLDFGDLCFDFVPLGVLKEMEVCIFLDQYHRGYGTVFASSFDQ